MSSPLLPSPPSPPAWWEKARQCAPEVGRVLPCSQSPCGVTSGQMAGLSYKWRRFQTHGQSWGRAQGSRPQVLCSALEQACAVGRLALLVTCQDRGPQPGRPLAPLTRSPCSQVWLGFGPEQAFPVFGQLSGETCFQFFRAALNDRNQMSGSACWMQLLQRSTHMGNDRRSQPGER